MRHIRFLLPALFAGLTSAAALPHIFYTDLESGPNNGGEKGGGAYVTLFGKRFGAGPGSTAFVTVGDGRVANYPCWSETRICIQLGPTAQSGNIVVTTASGASNGVQFRVRPGHIYAVSPKGSDSNSGGFHSPWKTLTKARDSMRPGDITYAMDGVSQTADDGQGWNTCLLLITGGEVGRPMAIVGYPGATVTIGNVKGPSSAIRSNEHSNGNWVFANLTIRGQNEAASISRSNHWRFVNNDISCPNGDGGSACIETSLASNIQFLGNNVHETGRVGASALYHGVYFSTDSNHIDAGWNTIANVNGCRGLQFHSSPLNGGGPKDPTGHNQYDLIVHDNIIHDTQCDGIIFATVDPSQGKVEAFNNVIFNAGKGPANPENSGNWACIYVPGYTNTGQPGGGVVNIYNNTMFNCGTFATPPYQGSTAGVMNGEHNSALQIQIRNNIVFESGNIAYVRPLKGGIDGTNNLFFGSGPPPSALHVNNTVYKDPLFFNLAHNDFHLTAGSPARGAGVDVSAGFDLDGMPRDSTTGFDIGAFQSVAIPGSSSLGSLRR